MLSRIGKFCLIGIAGCPGIATSHADLPGGIPWGPPLQAIRDAASLRDPVAREAALREAIRKGLLESTPGIANEVFGYLSRNIRWLDLQPFEDVVMEYSKIAPTHRGTWLLDEDELFRAPREERLRTYSAAIAQGTTTLRHGRPLPRQSAMLLAAADGLAELKPLIETYYPAEPAEVRRRLPLAELLVRLDLGAGAADREDAGRLASERVAAMKDEEFRDRMNTDGAFRKVVEEISTYVCVGDPYLVRRNPGCGSIKDIVKRQLELETKGAQVRSLGDGAAARPPESFAGRSGTWLGKMQESSAGELSVPQRH